MSDNDFWQDKLNSQKIIKEKKLYEDLINSYSHSTKTLKDLDELYELALNEKNQSIILEILENTKNLKFFSTDHFKYILLSISAQS